MVGPSGCGKTLLASRLPGVLPEASETDALETAAIASISGHGLDLTRWHNRPFRSPHHTASAVALVGGGAEPRPGEISLTHNGVLFLDELPEWDRRALEVLREQLESGVVTISRAARQWEFAPRFQLVAAMNPCPCGRAGDPSGLCRCHPNAILRYRAKISGPLLERIDLHLEVPRLPPAELQAPMGSGSIADASLGRNNPGGSLRSIIGCNLDRIASCAGNPKEPLHRPTSLPTCRHRHQGMGCCPLRPAEFAALPGQSAGRHSGIGRLRGRSRELDKGRGELDCRLRSPASQL